MLEFELQRPDLKALVWGKNDVANFPKSYVEKYKEHVDEDIKNKFAGFMTRLTKLQASKAKGNDEPEAPVSGPRGTKRKLYQDYMKDAKPGSPEKNAPDLKAEGETAAAGTIVDMMPPTVAISTLSELVMAANIPCGKGTMAQLQVRDATHKNIFLSNVAAPEGEKIDLSSGTMLCSWWKGTWYHNANNEALSDADIPFVLHDSHDMVMIGTRLAPLSVVLAERREKQPGAKSCVLYHDVADDPRDGDPSFQTFKLKHSMVWRPTEGAPVSLA